MTNFEAASLSIADVQAAINLAVAAGGGTVVLPAGTGEWDLSGLGEYGSAVTVTMPVGDITIIGAGKTLTIISQTVPATANYTRMLNIQTGVGGGRFILKDLRLNGLVVTEGTHW